MNYNKIKRIVRAKHGSRIPKFLNPNGGLWQIPSSQQQLYNLALNWSLPNFSNPNPFMDGSSSPINTLRLFTNTASTNYSNFLKNNKPSFLNKLGNKAEQFLKTSTGQSMMGIGLDYLGGQFSNVENSGDVNNAFATVDTVGNIVGTVNPMAGLAVKAGSTLLKGINSIGGKRANLFSINQNTIENVGGSYGGSVDDINNAALKAGKKYGLFSSGKRHKANRQIREAKRLLNIMTDIADEVLDLRAMINDLNYIRHMFDMNGGYDLSNIRVAKSGMKILDKINLVKAKKFNSSYINVNTKTIEEFKLGGSILPEWEPIIEDIWESVIEEFKEGGTLQPEWEPIIELQEGGKIRTLEELIEYAKKENPRFILRLSEPPRGIEFIDDEGNKGIGNVYLEWSSDDKGNAIIYPRILEMSDKSLKFLSSDEAWKRANENNNILIMSPKEAQIFFAEDPEYQTAYKRGWPEMFKNYSKKVESSVKEFKEGGVVKEETSEIEETNQKNVIPEGALHKNRHHMEHTEGLTQKGIPVVDNEGSLQAEIELNEIIFNLEVTKFMEERYRKYFNDDMTQKEKDLLAIEVGELLVDLILNNTDDRTNLIAKCKEGGKL